MKIVGEVPKGLPRISLPALRRDALDEPPRARPADLDRRLRGVDLGRPDARGEAPAARRPRPGADRARRGEPRRGRLRRLPGHRRPGAVRGQLRGRGRDPRGRRVHGGRHRARDAVPHAAAVLPAEGDPGRDHRRRRSVARGLLGPQAHVGLLEGRLRGDGSDDPRHAREGRGAGAGGGRGPVDLPPPLRHVAAAHRGGGPDPGHDELPQRGAPRGRDRLARSSRCGSTRACTSRTPATSRTGSTRPSRPARRSAT